MFCNQCGGQIPEGQLTCPICGAYVDSSNQANAQNGYVQPDVQNQQNGYGQPYQANQQNGYGQPYQANQPNGYGQPYQANQPNGYGQPNQPNGYGQANQPNGMQQPYGQSTYSAPQKQLGMGWFNFIIYVQLFLNALLNGISSFQLFTGAQYKQNSYSMADYVYRHFPGLETADKLYGVGVLALAIFAIVVRFMLAGFKKIGPTCYFILLALNIVFAFIYLGAAASILHVSLGDLLTTNFYANVLGSVILFAINIVYFKNRKHLFVN